MKFYTDIYIKQINFIIKPLPVTRTGGGSASREMETVRCKEHTPAACKNIAAAAYECGPSDEDQGG